MGEAVGLYDRILKDIQTKRTTVTEELHPYSLNVEGGVLGNVECPICNNTGRTITKDGFTLHVKECECMNVRRNKKRLAESGLLELMDEYNLKTYTAIDKWTSWAKNKALEYIDAPRGWFYVHGITGSGKTHICTAICSELMKKGKTIRYVIWTDLVKDLNAVVNDLEFGRILNDLKRVDVLYVDDFLKNGESEATAKRAFDVINARYNQPSKKTIISSERSLNFVANIDPAIAGRINQRSRGFYLKTPDKDWRLSM